MMTDVDYTYCGGYMQYIQISNHSSANLKLYNVCTSI